ncbi:unnamed protein product [Didymodactylos carnosus]|uniref:SecA DEAD-like N-terminal domain-containing protein n=1 Tax=Didymodactylos carnosus TaxID=1234261 RepID=A0A8S2Q8U7_9BILA|nr:unnamed protein product [Didymodactylos carnosus]CAF4095072.1 unnamed protein product [Didymodactylos carnosus]
MFSNIMKVINTLKAIKSKFKDILSSTFDDDKLVEDLKTKIERIMNQLLGKASKSELSTKDADDFRMYYNHILSFDKHVRISSLNSRQVLEKSEEEIFKKVTSLRKDILAFGLDAIKVCNALIKMKFFAENLSMFDKTINSEIDEALKSYKEKQGSAGIVRLTVELEKTEVGARLINEHSCLSGEDWRKRREKMQKQDDLEYILERLTGDDVDKNVLRSRYTIFRSTYDNLVSINLNLFDKNADKEPDLEMLVTQTKYLVQTVIQTSKFVTWKSSFMDKIPELVAYVFAIWTLQKTEYYNTMRGIEAAKAYLLMPHVGQVIAIFRLLGIGYKKDSIIPLRNVSNSKTISNDLVNNLVEIGTGEGKSVVLAVTSCIFALTGVDVNCSCYSEVLSMRDKSDFAASIPRIVL